MGNFEYNLTTIDDIDEGQTQEKLIWAALESVFPNTLYKNPNIKNGEKYREFIDILAFHELGIFLIESKSPAVLSLINEKTMEKKVSTLQYHIRKGIRQLIGAKKTLDKDGKIYDSKNNEINFDNKIIPHCIVLVPELLLFGDWTDIVLEVKKTIVNEMVYLNILDFAEFVNLLKLSKGRKEYLDYYLMARTEEFIKNETIFLKSSFDN